MPVSDKMPVNGLLRKFFVILRHSFRFVEIAGPVNVMHMKRAGIQCC